MTLMNESGELTPHLKFHVEHLTMKFVTDHEPLYKAHCAEVGWFKEDTPEMMWGDYFAMDKMNVLRIYTVRDAGFNLIGYGIYLVRHNMHYASVKAAYCDMIYIKPEHRGGLGEDFIKWVDQRLKDEGVNSVVHHAKVYYDFGSMLNRLEYEHVENIYIRRLN